MLVPEGFGVFGRRGLSMEVGGRVSPLGFALQQLAPVTCSISRTPGDHIASNTPETPIIITMVMVALLLVMMT